MSPEIYQKFDKDTRDTQKIGESAKFLEAPRKFFIVSRNFGRLSNNRINSTKFSGIRKSSRKFGEKLPEIRSYYKNSGKIPETPGKSKNPKQSETLPEIWSISKKF